MFFNDDGRRKSHWYHPIWREAKQLWAHQRRQTCTPVVMGTVTINNTLLCISYATICNILPKYDLQKGNTWLLLRSKPSVSHKDIFFFFWDCRMLWFRGPSGVCVPSGLMLDLVRALVISLSSLSPFFITGSKKYDHLQT